MNISKDCVNRLIDIGNRQSPLMPNEYEISDFENGEMFGTVVIKIPNSNHVQFGYKADLYYSLMNMTSSDVISSYKGDEFSVPNVPKSTFRAIVDNLSDHPSNPWFSFIPGGFNR